jgi:hypothetical protein
MLETQGGGGINMTCNESSNINDIESTHFEKVKINKNVGRESTNKWRVNYAASGLVS